MYGGAERRMLKASRHVGSRPSSQDAVLEKLVLNIHEHKSIENSTK